MVYACQRVGRASGLNFCFWCLRCSISRTGGRCFRGISTFGGGAFSGYTPAGREGMRAEPFIFALPPLNFHGAGGRGGAGFDGSLLSAAALLVYVCQRVGRVNGENFYFALPLFNFPGSGSGVFLQISTIGGGAFGICMPACREGERTEPFFFALAPFHFPGAGAGVFRQISTINGGAFCMLCMPAGRKGELGDRFFSASVVQFSLSGGGEGERISVDRYPRRRPFGTCMPACREGKRTELLFFVLAPFNFPGPGGGVFGGSLQSAAAPLVDTFQRDERGSALHCSHLRFRR